MDLKTKHLHIRDIQMKDLDAMIALWMDPIVKQGMGSYGPQMSDEVLPWVEDVIVHNKAAPRFAHNCAIVATSWRQVIGWIGVGTPSEREIGDIDFGFALRSQFQGRGYGTEALRTVIEFCFREMGVNSMFGETRPENTVSARVMERAGMWRAGVSDDDHIIFRIEKVSTSQGGC